MPGYIILHKCTKKKMKIKKKIKKNPGDIILQKHTKNHGHTVPEIWHMTDVIVTFHFGLFFGLLPL